MSENWASEHLRTIRTLMERTAIYRRALAPVSLVAGLIGVVSAAGGILLGVMSARGFVIWWVVTGIIGLGMSLLLVRKQALHDQEAIWSPPTRRVAEAVSPALASGLIIGILFLSSDVTSTLGIAMLPILWMLLFGCALHSAGFFMQRGIRLVGWVYIVTALIETGLLAGFSSLRSSTIAAHGIMGAVFGGYHLAWCIYLYLTEPTEK